MTTINPNQISDQVASRYANLNFAPITKKPDTSKNGRRGARKTQKRTFIK